MYTVKIMFFFPPKSFLFLGEVINILTNLGASENKMVLLYRTVRRSWAVGWSVGWSVGGAVAIHNSLLLVRPSGNVVGRSVGWLFFRFVGWLGF